MNIRSIDNVLFKKLYIANESYNSYQQTAVDNIKNQLTPEVVNKLDARGYDIYVNKSTFYDDSVNIYASKHLSSEIIRIGGFGKNDFNVDSVYQAINKKEKDDKTRRIIGWTLIGAAAAGLLANIILSGSVKKSSKEIPISPKLKTELAQYLK